MGKPRPWRAPEPLPCLALLGFPRSLDPPPAPAWPIPTPHPHPWAPVVKFQDCCCRGNSQLTRAPPPGFSSRPLLGRRQRASHPWGPGESQAGEAVRSSWFLSCFPKEKMEKAQSTASKCYSVITESSKDRGGHLDKELLTSHLENHPMERPETKAF